MLVGRYKVLFYLNLKDLKLLFNFEKSSSNWLLKEIEWENKLKFF